MNKESIDSELNTPDQFEKDIKGDSKDLKDSIEGINSTDTEIKNGIKDSTKDLDIDSNSISDKESTKVPDKDSDNGINKDTDKDGKESKDNIHPGSENLIPLSERTKEEQREIAKLGGIRSGEVRKARKTAREILQEMLQRQLSNDQIDDILGTSKNLLGEEKTAYAVINAKMIQIAAAGDTKAYNAVRDTVGDAPVQEQRIETINTPGDMALYEKVARRLEKSNKKTEEAEDL